MSFNRNYLHKFTTQTVVVDNFKARIPGTLTFLTHFHSDHYQGITRESVVYCSQMTSDILRQKFKQTKTIVVAGPMDLHGLLVTPIPANHTPDAVMFLFEDLRTHTTVLFTGDFKYDIAQPLCQTWYTLRNMVNKLVLDTTYIDVAESIPYELAISKAVRSLKSRFDKGRHKLLVFSYSVGKERIIQYLASYLLIKFFPQTAARKESLKAIYRDRYDQYFTDLDDDSGTLITGGGEAASRKIIGQYSNFDHIFVLEATGWVRNFAIYPDKLLKNVTHIKTPYSEHCSLYELRDFVQLVGKCDMGVFSILAHNEHENDAIVRKLAHVELQQTTVLNQLSFPGSV